MSVPWLSEPMQSMDQRWNVQWHRAPKVHAAFDHDTKLTIANALEHENQGTRKGTCYVNVRFALLESG